MTAELVGEGEAVAYDQWPHCDNIFTNSDDYRGRSLLDDVVMSEEDILIGDFWLHVGTTYIT
jgi:hypothetical protein